MIQPSRDSDSKCVCGGGGGRGGGGGGGCLLGVPLYFKVCCPFHLSEIPPCHRVAHPAPLSAEGYEPHPRKLIPPNSATHLT